MATRVAAATPAAVRERSASTERRRAAARVEELPLLGSMRSFNRDRLGFLEGMARSYGDAALMHFGPFPALFVNAPDLVHATLVEHAADFYTGEVRRIAFGPILGQGLFTSEGELHRRQRKAMAPAFQPRHIQGYAEAMVDYAERAQAGWSDGATVAINHEMIHITMSVIGKVLFDADVFTEADELGAAITEALEHINYAISRILPIPLSWPLPRHRRTRRAIAFLDARIQQMIDERRRPLAPAFTRGGVERDDVLRGGVERDDVLRGGVERDDFLSILLRTRDEDGNPMSDQQVHDEAVTLFGAGHETTATGLTWAWYLLATNPEAAARLRDEVDGALGGRPPTYADLPRLPYALQVFKEALRLYPPAYVLSRVALRDVEVAGHPVKKGMTVMMSPYALHRRADLYPSPTRFDPDRFTPEHEARLPRHAYMPFGAGPRICIGNHFALMEGQLILATLAQRVRLELVPGQHVVPEPKVTPRPRDDIRMTVRRR